MCNLTHRCSRGEMRENHRQHTHVQLGLVGADDAEERLCAQGLHGGAVSAEVVRQEHGAVTPREVVVEQHGHVESLEDSGRLEGRPGERALDAAPVRDGGEVHGQAHLLHEVGPRRAQDVEDGRAHGVADVVQLVGGGHVEHLVEEGRQVVGARLVQRVVPEAVVVVQEAHVRAGVGGAARVGQPHVVASVRQQEGQVVVPAAQHPVVGALQHAVGDEDGAPPRPALRLRLRLRLRPGLPLRPAAATVAAAVADPLAADAVLLVGPRRRRPRPAVGDADQLGHVVVRRPHRVRLHRVALAADQVLRGHDGPGVVQRPHAPVEVASQLRRGQHPEDGALQEADLR